MSTLLGRITQFGLFGVLLLIAQSYAQAAAQNSVRSLTVLLKDPSTHQYQELKAWQLSELDTFKQAASQERDPRTGKVCSFKGVLLSSILEKALGGIGAERKSDIDLIILKGEGGRQALIPRSLVVKYPLMLAVSASGKALGSDGPLYSVMPWTSHARITEERVPLESYFVSNVQQVELVRYEDVYGTLLLKRRTDPSAMKGEGIFKRNCVFCHANGQGPAIRELAGESKSRTLSSVGHPLTKGVPELKEADRRYISSYLDAYRGENPGTATGPFATQQTAPVLPH